jgi:hypothetical protein
MNARARRLLAALVLPLMVLALGGCGGGDEPTSPRAEASKDAPEKVLAEGTCWGDQLLADALGPDAFADWVEKYAGGDSKLGESMRDDAAFSQSVDCAEPHALELYNVVEVAPALTARVKEYSDLLDQGTPLYRRIRDQVNDRCYAGSPYGKAQRRGGGMPVQLGPALSVRGGLHLAWDPFPADLWAKGQQKFVCTLEQDEPGTLRFADLTTSKVPITARICLNTPRKYVSCRGPHNAEDIAEMILNTAIEKGQINGRKAVRKGPDGRYVALQDAEYARLDKICQTFLSSVSKVPDGIEARAYPGSVAQWPTDTGVYVASCFALEPVSDPPPKFKGTVFNKP